MFLFRVFFLSDVITNPLLECICLWVRPSGNCDREPWYFWYPQAWDSDKLGVYFSSGKMCKR